MTTVKVHPSQITNSYYSQNFELTNQELRKHFRLANREIDQVKEHVNDLVVIVHKDNKLWSLNKICDYIAGKNDDLSEYGFSARTIFRYLSDENRQLTDTKKQKGKNVDVGLKPSQELEELREQKGTKLENNVIEPDDDTCHHRLIEESSRTSVEEEDEDQTQIWKLEQRITELIKENADLKAENFRLKKDYQELDTKYKKLLNKSD